MLYSKSDYLLKFFDIQCVDIINVYDLKAMNGFILKKVFFFNLNISERGEK